MNKESVKKNLESVFKNETNVTFAFLFGSVAKNNLRYGSDIDIAIYFKDEPALIEIGDLTLKIEKALNCKLDLVRLNDLDKLNPVLAYNVISEGIILINNDNRVFTEFIKSVVLRYLDFKPVNDFINKSFNKRLANNQFAVFDK
ncbi:MAG: nucleotidyltransferase domain-containing protein [Ignavibacteriaceae bacterium]|jgi:predicted nucleotidyltransferase|nr:nucleotidyltransferase domain-containing protein [Ignavibacteriaceae bacterium]